MSGSRYGGKAEPYANIRLDSVVVMQNLSTWASIRGNASWLHAVNSCQGRTNKGRCESKELLKKIHRSAFMVLTGLSFPSNTRVTFQSGSLTI